MSWVWSPKIETINAVQKKNTEQDAAIQENTHDIDQNRLLVEKDSSPFMKWVFPRMSVAVR